MKMPASASSIAKSIAFAALILGVISISPIRGAAAGTKSIANPHTALFVANPYDVTSYPTDSSGNVAPIALTTDMANPSGIARDGLGRIYVTNAATKTVTIYAATSNGNVPPIAVIGGANTGLADPGGIALDANRKIYVVNGARTGKASITIYAALGSSVGTLNEAPIATIAGAKTLLDQPTGIALDSQNNIYVANEMGGPVVRGASFDTGRVSIYPAGSNGNIAPVATISGAGTGLSFPVGIAVDSSGNIYVANFRTANTQTFLKLVGSITVYSAGSKGNASPIAIIAGEKAALEGPESIALDSSRDLFVTVVNSPSGLSGGYGFAVNVYSAGSDGNASPGATISGADTGLAFPDGIAIDSVGRFYVSNSSGGPTRSGSVTIFPAGSSGDAFPTATIASNFTGLESPADISVDSIGNIYVAQFGVDTLHSSVNIYSAGSYAVVPPIATITGPNTGFFVPKAVAVDSDRNIYVLNLSNAITEYPADSNGDVTPTATLNIPGSGSDSPTGIAVSAYGKLYVVSPGSVHCGRRSCHQVSTGQLAIYPPGSDGDAKPSAVISGPSTALASPQAVALDGSGNIYVANDGPMKCSRGCGCFPIGAGSITVYPPGSNGDVMPIRTIAGAATGIAFPYRITLDSNGNIYVLNATGFGFVCVGPVFLHGIPKAGTIKIHEGPILIFAAGSDGNTAPISTIGGPLTGLEFPVGIAVGPAAHNGSRRNSGREIAWLQRDGSRLGLCARCQNCCADFATGSPAITGG
jgi:hypothetical protein